MANARLHVICGNCGSGKGFTFSIDPKGHDITKGSESEFEPAVFIYCENCSTLHDLSDNAKLEKEE